MRSPRPHYGRPVKRRLSITVFALILLVAALSGCVQPSTPAIFDREPTVEDELPAELTIEFDAKTGRYVGVDSAGNSYWVVRTGEFNSMCIVVLPEADAEPASGCGAPPITLTIGNKLTVELADFPNQLSQSNAELLGDTLLVGTTP